MLNHSGALFAVCLFVRRQRQACICADASALQSRCVDHIACGAVCLCDILRLLPSWHKPKPGKQQSESLTQGSSITSCVAATWTAKSICVSTMRPRPAETPCIKLETFLSPLVKQVNIAELHVVLRIARLRHSLSLVLRCAHPSCSASQRGCLRQVSILYYARFGVKCCYQVGMLSGKRHPFVMIGS